MRQKNVKLHFLLMLRRRPRSTRWTYTTLGRSVDVPLLRAQTEMAFTGFKTHEACVLAINRSEEHTSYIQSRRYISYAVCCLKKKYK